MALQQSPALVVPITSVQSDFEPKTGLLQILTKNTLAVTVKDAYNAFQARREAFGLVQPGALASIDADVRDVMTDSQPDAMPGLHGSLTSTLGLSPVFQTAHKFSPGSQMMPPYNFEATLSRGRTEMSSVWGSEAVQAVLQQTWSQAFTTAVMAKFADESQGPGLKILNMFTGRDSNLRTTIDSPSLTEDGLNGSFSAQYLQSVTPRVSLGLEAQYARQSMGAGVHTAGMLAYAARYRGDTWTASAQLSPFSSLQASYWQKLSRQVEAGATLQVSQGGMGGMMGPRNDATASFGAKYTFNTSQFRAKVDSDGKVAALLETNIFNTPMLGLRVSFYGELDHVQNTSKTGLTLSLDSQTEAVAADIIKRDEERQMEEMRLQAAATAPATTPTT